MIFNNSPNTILFTLLCASVAMAEIKIEAPCYIIYGTFTSPSFDYTFYLTADKITAKAGSIDIDETMELGVLETSCRQLDTQKDSKDVDGHPYTKAKFSAKFNTSKVGLIADMSVEITRYNSGWNVTNVMVGFHAPSEGPYYVKGGGWEGSGYIKTLSEEEVKELGWHSPPEKGYKCSSTIHAGKLNDIELENMRLFPFLKRGQTEPTKDEDYEVCKPAAEAVSSMPWWAILLIAIGVLAIVGGLGSGGYRLYQTKYGH